MGTVGSKSPLERRNTVARRSQRRTLHNLKPKVEQLHKAIKKFKGVDEDVNFVALKNEIEYLKNDLTRRAKDLQPQVRNLYENIYKRVYEADDALLAKLAENKEKKEKKDAKLKENGDVLHESDILSDVTNDPGDNETIVQVHAADAEAHHFENSEDKRKTVELKIVKVVAEEASPNLTNKIRIATPAEKRKSILKVGIPVMPGAVMDEFNAQTTRINRQYDHHISTNPKTLQEVLSRINDIVESLRKVEVDINEFVGKRHGKQYTKIRDGLNRYLIELNGLSPVDDYAIEQVKICRNYIGSCLSFLDERAVDDKRPESFASDEDVFENNNLPAMMKVEENFKMQMLLKSTPV